MFYPTPITYKYSRALDATDDEFGIPSSIQTHVGVSDDMASETVHEQLSGRKVVSIGWPGQLYFPDTAPYEPCDNNWSPYPVYSQHVDPVQYSRASYAVPLDYDNVALPIQYPDTSQSPYRTDWESHMHSYANSQKLLTRNHINTELLNHDFSNVIVMQQFQELGNLPTSGSEYPRPLETTPYVHPLEHDTLAQGVQAIPSYYQSPETTIPTYPTPEMAWNTSAINIPSMPHPFNPVTSHSMDPSPSSSSSAPLYPITPTDSASPPSAFHSYPLQHDISAQISTPHAIWPSFFSSPSYPVSSTDNALSSVAPNLYPFQPATCSQPLNPETTIPQYPPPEMSWPVSTAKVSFAPDPIPSRPHNSWPYSSSSSSSFPSSSSLYPVSQPLTTTVVAPVQPPLPFPTHQTLNKSKCQRPPKKLGRSPKKNVSAPKRLHPEHPSLDKCKSPDASRAPVRSRWWLDTFFAHDKTCKLCNKRMSQWREDRALEHLVSVHVVQVVKNIDKYDRKALARESKGGKHLVETEAQFAFAREQVDKIRCSFCRNDTSLVFRETNAKQHLKRVHGKLDENVRRKEMERIRAIEPQQSEWYSYQDKFLFHFPRATAPALSEEV